MHHDREKSQSIRSPVTALGLLKKKKDDEQIAWVVISRLRMPTSNMISVKLKAAINADAPVQHV